MKNSKIAILVIIVFLIGILSIVAYHLNQKSKLVKLASSVIWVSDNGVQKYIVNDSALLEDLYIPLIALEDLSIFVDYDKDEDIVILSDGYTLQSIDINNAKTDEIISYENELFIRFDSLDKKFNLQADYDKKSGMVFVKNLDQKFYATAIKRSTYLKTNSESDNIRKIKSNEMVVILSIDNDYANVITGTYEYGKIALNSLNKNVNDEFISFYDKNDRAFSLEENSYKNRSGLIDGKIFLIWDIPKKKEDLFISNKENITVVVSKTAYKLGNDKGKLSGSTKNSHIEHIREHGYLCWPIITNDFNPDMTHVFLNSAKSRKRFIDNIEKEWNVRGYDGVNIDFENIFKKDKNKFTQFMAELGAMCKKNNIILSVDVTVMGGSDNWSKCYDRKSLGKIVDYMAVMTYDEHWSTSPISGSVSSYNWAKKNMIRIKKDVPNHKLLLGIPYYMRVWSEVPSKVSTMMDNTSKVLTMKHMDSYIQKNNLNLIWDDDLKQYYSAIIKDNVLIRVWFEEEKSIAQKVSLVKELDLKGVAIWQIKEIKKWK